MLKAYQIDDCDTWAGTDAEDAVRNAMKQQGPHADRRDYLAVDEIRELPRSAKVLDSEPGDENETYTTVGAILDGMTEPGIVCSTEY